MSNLATAKEKIRLNQPLSIADMQALQQAGLASESLKLVDKTGFKFPVGGIYKAKEVHDTDGTTREIIIEVKKGLPYKEVEKVVEHVPAWMIEERRTAEQKAQIEREDALNAFWETYSHLSGKMGCMTFTPLPTLAELKAKVLKKTIEQIKNGIASTERLVQWAEELTEQKHRQVVEMVLTNHNHPANFDWEHDTFISEDARQRIRSEIAEKETYAFTKPLRKINRGLPYVKEILAVYREALLEKEKILEQQRASVEPKLKELEKLSKTAAKVLRDIEKLGAELRKNPKKKTAVKLKQNLELYDVLNQEYSSTLAQIDPYRLDFHLQIPGLPELPAGAFEESVLKLALSGYYD